MFIKINGKTRDLWRAVDQDGVVLDILVQPWRNAAAATRFFRRLLTGLRYVPWVVITDKLRSYGAAHHGGDALGGAPILEVSEQPGRELPSTHPATRTCHEGLHLPRPPATVPVQLQGISPHFRTRRHRLTAAGWREEMNSDHALLTIDRDHTLRLPG